MFTGLITEQGLVVDRRSVRAGLSLSIESSFEGLELGESIAINGVCLSVTHFEGGSFEVEASAETLRLTTLDSLSIGTSVNLERALRLGDRLGGHLVSGHVDGIGTIQSITSLGRALSVQVEVPAPLAPFLAPKGSITINGTSLTINTVSGTHFTVAIIPITQDKTSLGRAKEGDAVNLEVDILAKYVASLLGRPGIDGEASSHAEGEGLPLPFLKDHGFA